MEIKFFKFPIFIFITHCLRPSMSSDVINGYLSSNYTSDVTVVLTDNSTIIDSVKLVEGIYRNITLTLDGRLPKEVYYMFFNASSQDGWSHFSIEPQYIDVHQDTTEDASPIAPVTQQFTVSLAVQGEFLGFATLSINAASKDSVILYNIENVEIKVSKKEELLEKVFLVSIMIMLLMAYVNMGCALNLEKIKKTLKQPVAPSIGLFSQYFFMPLVSYGIGYGLFNSSPELWLGLFLTGCSPGGGGSNLWTYALDGDLDLSVTMTFVSTVLAFVSFPFWVFVLGKTIPLYSDKLSLPFANIAGLVVSLICPLAIGIIIQIYKPKVAAFMIKLLKPTAILFIILAVVVGSFVNYHIFFFFTWKVVLAGICLPWLGFLCGGLLAKLAGRTWKEIIAISVETGIQNIGIAIAVMKLALISKAPLGDIAIVVPIAVATMTPLPLISLYLSRRVYLHYKQRPSVQLNESQLQPNPTNNSTVSNSAKDSSSSQQIQTS